jgi:hypothetical protein
MTYTLLSQLIVGHNKCLMIVQRYIPTKGSNPSIVRCDLNIDRYPDVDIGKLVSKLSKLEDGTLMDDEDYIKSLKGQKKSKLDFETEKQKLAEPLLKAENPLINLKVFKICSKHVYSGLYQNERVNGINTFPETFDFKKALKQNEDEFEQMFPLVRIDHKFVDYLN